MRRQTAHGCDHLPALAFASESSAVRVEIETMSAERPCSRSTSSEPGSSTKTHARRADVLPEMSGYAPYRRGPSRAVRRAAWWIGRWVRRTPEKCEPPGRAACLSWSHAEFLILIGELHYAPLPLSPIQAHQVCARKQVAREILVRRSSNPQQVMDPQFLGGLSMGSANASGHQ